jgi:hypothetical protein
MASALVQGATPEHDVYSILRGIDDIMKTKVTKTQ